MHTVMPFPESERVTYRENPLIEVICQLRYPTILNISAAEPADFQDRVRGQYPMYEKSGPAIGVPPEVPKELAALLSQAVAAQVDTGPTYKFVTDDSTGTITLTRDFISWTDADYQAWEPYRANVELARGALQAVYDPAFFTRIGLRYKNAIDKARLGLSNEPWDALLNPDLIGGLLGSTDLQPHVTSTQTIAVIRIDEVAGGFVNLRHGLAEVPQEDQAQPYVLDADFYTTDRGATEDTMGTLDTFNRISGHLFRWAVTPRLESALRPEP